MEHEVSFFIVIIATHHCFYPEPDESSEPFNLFLCDPLPFQPNTISISLRPLACNMFHAFHHLWFHLINNTLWEVRFQRGFRQSPKRDMQFFLQKNTLLDHKEDTEVLISTRNGSGLVECYTFSIFDFFFFRLSHSLCVSTILHVSTISA